MAWEEKEKERECTHWTINTSMGLFTLQHSLKGGIVSTFWYSLAKGEEDHLFDIRSVIYEIGEEASDAIRELADFRHPARLSANEVYERIEQAILLLDKKMGLSNFFAMGVMERQSRHMAGLPY